MNRFRLACCCLLLSMLVGCAADMPQRKHSTAKKGGEYRPRVAWVAPAPQAENIKAALYAQHDAWAGTPYRLGGLSRNGIDCSGFVYTTFRRQFGRDLPRTTASQARIGYTVSVERLRPGDLLFFQTGRSRRHVGIYVEDDKFLHASTSQGVVLSSLDDPYWASSFWKAQRLSGLVANR